MSVIIVKESKKAFMAFYIPNSIAAEEEEFRNFLVSLRQSDNQENICFWIRLEAGGLKAYYQTVNGFETRTYSREEIIDAIIDEKKLFFHAPAELVLILGETGLV